MFKLNNSPTYTWPVKVNLPADGGKFETATFDAEFKRVSQASLDETRGQVDRGELTDAQFARQILVGWKGVSEDGEELPFSEDNRDRLLNVPGVSAALVVAFIESVSGLKRKNS